MYPISTAQYLVTLVTQILETKEAFVSHWVFWCCNLQELVANVTSNIQQCIFFSISQWLNCSHLSTAWVECFFNHCLKCSHTAVQDGICIYRQRNGDKLLPQELKWWRGGSHSQTLPEKGLVFWATLLVIGLGHTSVKNVIIAFLNPELDTLVQMDYCTALFAKAWDGRKVYWDSYM